MKLPPNLDGPEHGDDAGVPDYVDETPPQLAGEQLVLLVEDSPVAHEKISGILRDQGCVVVSAYDGVEGLARAKEYGSGLALVVLDIQMPRMDGITTLRYLRQLSSLSQVPIVMLTTQADKDTVRSALTHKANDYIRKDSSIAAIAERFQHHLRIEHVAAPSGPSLPRNAEQAADMARKVLRHCRAADSPEPCPWVMLYEGRMDLQDMVAGKNPGLAHFYATVADALERLCYMYRGITLDFGLEHERQAVGQAALREEAPMGLLLVSGRRSEGASLARMVRFACPRDLPIYLICESIEAMAADQREAMAKVNVSLLERRNLGSGELRELFTQHLMPDFRETGSGLRFHELAPGAGPRPEPGQTLAIHYTASLVDGAAIGDSYSDDQPFRFCLGQGEVVAAWDEAVAMMKKGGRALVVSPPELAFGEKGDGHLIPPNATLIYSIELVAIEEVLPEENGDAAEGVN